MCQYLNIGPTYVEPGLWPISDNVGFTIALHLLRTSQLKGTYSKISQEFDTIRNLQTIYLHTHERSLHASELCSEFRSGEII